MKKPNQPFLVAIVGGSSSGKTRLADKLKTRLGSIAGRLSLDDFYRDHSDLSPARRAVINFDNPTAVEWRAFEQVLDDCLHWRSAEVPRYDFATHARLPNGKTIRPKPVMIVDGLWLLRRPRIRRLFGIRIFLKCPPALRLQRRLARDLSARGRRSESIREQFRKTVQPMHRKYVEPQIRWAHFTIGANWEEKDVNLLTDIIKKMPCAL